MTNHKGIDRRSFISLVGAAAAGSACAPLARRDAAAPSQDGERQEQVESPRSGAQRIFWSVDTKKPVAAVTFDDGPDPQFTPRILEVLDAYGVKATFMVMGHAASQHQSLLHEVVAAGHEIGGHGWKHLNLAEATVEEVRREVEHGTKVIEDVAGLELRVFRPPYGRFSEAAVKLLAPSPRDLVIWSVTRGELRWKDPALVANHVINSTGPGDIIDLHDGIGRGTFSPDAPFAERLRDRRRIEIDALPRMLDGLLEGGLKLRTVSDLLTAA